MNESVRHLTFWILFWMAPMAITVALAQFFMTLPARRNERARLFLDLLETGLRQGQSPERTIISISETRDRSVSVHFHLLAAHLDEGATFREAIERARGLLPPGVAEVVKIGAGEVSLDRLLPAARAMLVDATSRMRGALNYVVVFLIVMVPAALFVLPVLSIFICPKLQQVLADMEVTPPELTTFVFNNIGFATAIEAVVIAAMLFMGFFYVSGPRALRWANVILGSLPDRFLWALPWRRRRMQRDFTGVLAVLLDAGLPETRAVELAARATANLLFEKRAENVLARLRAGEPLTEAIRSLESGSEFEWRWQNALRSGKSFFAALRGWHESLEARAFHQEQAAAHAITSAIVVMNGALVACLAAAVFLILVSIIDEAVLW